MKQRIRRRLERADQRADATPIDQPATRARLPDAAGRAARRGQLGGCRTFPSMGHYRFYELDPSDHIMAGYSVECGSDAAAMRAARTLLERSAGVEVWKSNHCVAHLSAEARQLWGQLREDWMASC